jgi:hypothetical protein
MQQLNYLEYHKIRKMKKFLLAYQINGQTLGVDIHSWNPLDLNGNPVFKIIYSGQTIPIGYVDISSVIYWDLLGENAANDYMVVRFEIRDICRAKGWSSLTNTEKDIAIKHYISDNPTNAVIYLMSKGYSQAQAQGFVLMSWHKYHAKLLEACKQRLYYLKFVVPQYLSLADAEKLFDNASSLIYEFTELGRFGIAIGDKKSGILDYLMSTNDYAGAGMEESGLTLLQGTWDIFRAALTAILIDGIYTKY